MLSHGTSVNDRLMLPFSGVIIGLLMLDWLKESEV
jgi:hypothetical protein